MTDRTEFIASCKYDFPRFVMGAYDWGYGELSGQTGPDEWQLRQLKDVSEGLRHHEENGGPYRDATASGHGIGKSAQVSWITQAYMATRPHALLTVTANTERQLKTKTWRELAKWHKRSIVRDWFRWERESYRHVQHPDTWVANAIPWSENNSEAFAGQHEKYTGMIFDEASGIPNIIWEVASGAMTTPGAAWLVYGNPTRPNGRFYDCFNKQSHRWNNRQIDARSAKMADQNYLQELVDDFGLDSDYVRVRVLGQFPRQASAQLIPTDIVEQAQERRIPAEEVDFMPLIMGVDVARFGDDCSCFVWRKGKKIVDYEFHQNRDLSDLSRMVARHLERRPAVCFVDEIGYGAAVVDRLREWGFEPTGVSSQRRATNSKVYYNLRIELWDAMRAWLETADIPSEQRVKEQLIAPEYMFERVSGRMILERKEDMKKRGLESPDFADALAMTFMIPGLESPAIEDGDIFDRPELSGRDIMTGY